MLYSVGCVCIFLFFFFKQKTAYEMRISDWSSDVCSSDLLRRAGDTAPALQPQQRWRQVVEQSGESGTLKGLPAAIQPAADAMIVNRRQGHAVAHWRCHIQQFYRRRCPGRLDRSEEHTSELQSLMRISYAAFCLKKKTT